ncbi:carboxylesterase/lipase family protein [Streptomyces sp. NPDC012623]|uniref:carboxylesterase/lipase family protein n=1 Tax=unclassified Streptomyces TaxID=2593676 RepID=UPI0036A845DB
MDPALAVDLGEGRSVTGIREDGVAVFRGIPYAEAPTGAGRFAEPRPAAWTGVRDARAFGPTAPQPATDVPGLPDLSVVVGPGWVRGEDYLTVDVWTPDPEASPGAGALPVMVFVHGGSFVGGAGRTTGYDGTSFARDGVVLVTLNYRVGIPGFLRLPGAPDNRGLRDQICALRWVRDHIARFGGDPANVTVFGESAGALSVGALLAAAPAGLFRRAISQSGGASHAFTPAQADRVTAAVAELLGVPATVDAFAAIPDEALVQAVIQVSGADVDLTVDGVRDPLMGLSKLGPVVDGDLLTEQPVDAVRKGAADGVDLLVGSNRDEMNLYLVALPAPPVTEEALRAVASGLHPDPDALVAAYREAGRGESPDEVHSAIGTDYMFAVPTARLAEAHAGRPAATWRYEFTWPSPAADGRMGACHGLELPFVFDIVGRIDTGAFGIPSDVPAVRELARDTHAAWVAFARDGDPGWPRFTADEPAVRRIDTEWTLTHTADGPERSLWHNIR